VTPTKFRSKPRDTHQIQVLDRQGNLTGLVNGSNSWSYAYNSLNLPYEQSLSLDSKTYTIGLAYNNHGHLQSKTYGGTTLTYAPNALGLPTQVADSQTYASDVLYDLIRQHWTRH